MRVLDAFRPRGATWSGHVISSPPGPSGGPSKTHLLPGGGVPRVHRARSPVPPRLPHFTTPRSVHQFAAVAAGAYPLRRPPKAWSPGASALPGPCYWLVASGTPVGWRGGCLALGLVRSAVRHYCLGGCSALVVCARRSRPVRGGWGWGLVLCLPRFPLSAPRFLRSVWRAVPSGCPLSSLAGTPFHAVCAFRGLGPVALLVFPACPLCVCALALSRRPRPPPPPRVGVARAPRAVPVLGAGRAVPLGPCPSACPASVPCSVWLAWGGGGPVPFPPTWLGAACSPWGGCGRGGPSPTPPRALLLAGFARCGDGMRVPGGGASCLGVGRLGSGALPPPTARPLGVRPGPTTHWLWVWGGAGVGTRHQPHSARSCELALRAVGAARGRPGGAPLAWVWGAWGQALSHPRPLALWAYGRGPLPTGCGCGGVRAWGPVTNPTARALASWLCALWGRHEDARGGRLLPGCGPPGVRRSPTPDRSPSGRTAGPHYPLAVGVWGCGRGDPSPTPQRALLRAGFARCGGGTRTPGGGASCLGVGRLGSGALPPPTACPLGVRPGPTTHWLWVCGGAGVGTRHQTHSARSCELALRAVGAARGRPGGAPLACPSDPFCTPLSVAVEQRLNPVEQHVAVQPPS